MAEQAQQLLNTPLLGSSPGRARPGPCVQCGPDLTPDNVPSGSCGQSTERKTGQEAQEAGRLETPCPTPSPQAPGGLRGVPSLGILVSEAELTERFWMKRQGRETVLRSNFLHRGGLPPPSPLGQSFPARSQARQLGNLSQFISHISDLGQAQISLAKTLLHSPAPKSIHVSKK